ncbi:MAG: tetratricopeptide repeat protein [Kiritimatiellae bacterium]|nr:tetratricopeptide repeat protein [Kiritimatiellia bacterium]
MADLSEANVPKRARELFDKGLVATEHGNLPYAIDMFMAALDIEPHFLRARKFLRASALKQFNEAGGGGQLARVIATISAAPQLIKGWMALRAAKPQEALRLGEELLRSDPLNLVFIRFLCKAAEAAEMPEVAALTLAMVREYFQQDAGFLTWLGNLYMQMGQSQEAKECFEAVVTLKPHDAQAMQALKNAMARETMAKGGWDDAAKGEGGYRSIIKDVTEAAMLEKEAMAVKDSKSAELLIHDLEGRVNREPDNINYRRALANLYMQATRFDDAKHTIDEAKRLGGSTDPQLDQMLATIQLKQFDFEIVQCRENGDLAGVKIKEAAKRDFVFKNTEARIERYPNDLSLRYDYGVLLFERNMLNEAIQQFQMAQRNPHNRVRSLYYMARCFKQKQQFDMAREQLEKAAAELTEMDDLKKDILYQLGETLEAQGDAVTAVNKYYKEIYQVDIGYKDVAAKIERSYKSPPQA